ncbi:MAG: hypothetical protein NC433_14205 [Clostridiales bacterium]|nr:hypothetical protein [Clostridiales bacterium]
MSINSINGTSTQMIMEGVISGGAYEKRMIQKSLQAFSDFSTTEERQATEALKEKLKGVNVTISSESVEFLDGVKARKEAQKAEEERIRQEYSFLNPENAFNRIGTQFGIISDALSGMGFYDNLSDDEVLQVDRILSDITSGMNSVCGNVREVQPDSDQLSSYAARFELESSTAALRQFSEKFVPEEMQEDFNNLINQYYEHNAKILEGYRSSREISNELLSTLYDWTASKRAIPMDEEEKNIQKAGKVKAEESDIANAVESWKEQLKMLVNGEKSIDDSIAMMQDTLNALASGNSKNQSLLQYVNKWNSFSLENARQYWSLLINDK